MADIVTLRQSQHALLRNHDTVKFNPTVDFRECVMQGLYPGRKFVRISGINPDINAGTPADIWSGGGTFEFLPSPDFIDLVSDDASDSASGTGAQLVLLNGLDELGLETSEEIELNGLTPVQSSNTYIHVQRVRTIRAGASLFNVGTIDITGSSNTLLVGRMNPGFSVTTSAQFMVPTNQAYYLNGMIFALSKQTSVTAILTFYIKPDGGAWAVATIFGLSSQGSSIEYQTKGPAAYAPRTQVRIQVDVSGNNTQVTSFMEFLSVEILFTGLDENRSAGHKWDARFEYVGDG